MNVTGVTGAGAAASGGAGLVCRTWTLVYRGAIFMFIHEEGCAGLVCRTCHCPAQCWTCLSDVDARI